MSLTDILKKTALSLALAWPIAHMSYALPDADGTHQKSGFQEAKKGTDKAKREYLVNLLYDMKILYDKDKGPNGHVGAFYDYDNSDDKKKLEDWVNELAKNGQEVDKTAFEKARSKKLVYNLNGKLGENKKLPFIVVYSKDLFSFTEDDLKSTLDRVKAGTEAYDTGMVFEKKIPAEPQSWNSMVPDMYSDYCQLTKILDGTRKVSDELRQESMQVYQRHYTTFKKGIQQPAGPFMTEELRTMLKETIIFVDAGMKKLGYNTEYNADTLSWVLKQAKK
jgi:hypothetical protein